MNEKSQKEKKEKQTSDLECNSNRKEKQRLPFTSEILSYGIKENLSMSEVMALIIFRSYMTENVNPTCWIGLNSLSVKMRCCRTTAKKAVKSLQNKRLISIGKKRICKGGLENNEYQFTDKLLNTIGQEMPYSKAKNAKMNRAGDTIGQEMPYSRGRRCPMHRAGDALGIGQETPSSKTKKKQEKKQSSNKQKNDDDDDFLSSKTSMRNFDKNQKEKKISGCLHSEIDTRNLKNEDSEKISDVDPETVGAPAPVDFKNHSTLTEISQNRRKENKEDKILNFLERKGQSFADMICVEVEKRIEVVKKEIKNYYGYRLKIIADIMANPEKKENREFYKNFEERKELLERCYLKHYAGEETDKAKIEYPTFPKKQTKFCVNHAEFDKEMHELSI